MNPLMSQVLHESEFIEVDITYHASVEMDYLFNVVAFKYTMMKCKLLILAITYIHAYTIIHIYIFYALSFDPGMVVA